MSDHPLIHNMEFPCKTISYKRKARYGTNWVILLYHFHENLPKKSYSTNFNRQWFKNEIDDLSCFMSSC